MTNNNTFSISVKETPATQPTSSKARTKAKNNTGANFKKYNDAIVNAINGWKGTNGMASPQNSQNNSSNSQNAAQNPIYGNPVKLKITFRVKRNTAQKKAQTPDLDNLLRVIFNILIREGVIADDSLIHEIYARKKIVKGDPREPEGVKLKVRK